MSRTVSRTAAALIAIVTPALLGACGVRIPGVTPFRMDIQQGNYVTQEMLSQVKTGMSKEQVRQTLGTPLLSDVFHGERWDYIYWREDERGKREQRRVAVFFADGKLARLEGDLVPAKESAKPVAQ